jgi:hypothetical protein
VCAFVREIWGNMMQIWVICGQTESFLMFLTARIKNYRKRSVCPQVSQVPETVALDWQLAKAWLMRELSGKKSDEA